MADDALAKAMKRFDLLQKELEHMNCKEANDLYDEMARDWDRVDTLGDLARRLDMSALREDLQTKRERIRDLMERAYEQIERAGCTTYSAVTERELRG